MEISHSSISHEFVTENNITRWHKGTDSTTWLALPGITIVKQNDGRVFLRIDTIQARLVWVKYSALLSNIDTGQTIQLPDNQTVKLEQNNAYLLRIFCTPVSEIGVDSFKIYDVNFDPSVK